MHPTPRRRQRGLTLIEAMITLAVAGTLLGLGGPQLQKTIERRAIEGASAQFETDVQLARSEAVARGRTVRIDFFAGANGSCYVMHTGAAGDCECLGEAPVCRGVAGAVRSANYTADRHVTVQSNSRSIVFDPLHGTVTPTATVRVIARSGDAVHQIVNVMGRTRSCSPTLPGYRTC